MLRTTTATAVVMLTLAGTALADTHMAGSGAQGGTDMSALQGDLIRTRDITGAAIFTTDEAADEGWEIDTFHDALGPDWNEIGEVEDIVLSETGEMRGVVAEIGGLLDIGDKHVVLPVNDVNLVAVDASGYAVVTRLDEEELEGLRDVDEAVWN